MANMWVWKAINEAIDRETSRGSHKNTKSQTNYDEGLSSGSSSSGSDKVSELEELINNTGANPEIRDFFLMLIENVKEIDRVDAKTKFDDVHNRVMDFIDEKHKVEELLIEIANAGIDVDLDSQIAYSDEEVEKRLISDYNGSYITKLVGLTNKFNGIELNIGNRWSPENPIVDKYADIAGVVGLSKMCNYERDSRGYRGKLKGLSDKFDKQELLTRIESIMSKLGTEISELEKKLNSAEKRLKITLFKRETKKDDISSMKSELEWLKKDYERHLEYKKTIEVLEKMSESQKEKILNYSIQANKCRQIERDLHFAVGELEATRSGRMETSRQKWDKALDMAVDSGSMSEEDVKKIVNLLGNVVFTKEFSPDFEHFSCHFGSGSESLRCKKAIEWFVENMVKVRGIKDLERKDNELSGLEEEEKTISQTEKMIKIMINENQRNQGQDIGE